MKLIDDVTINTKISNKIIQPTYVSPFEMFHPNKCILTLSILTLLILPMIDVLNTNN